VRRLVAIWLAMALAAIALRIPMCSRADAADATPSDSVYQLQLALTTQDDHDATLDLDRGHPVLITMFYGNCPYACPLLINTMQRIEGKLDAARRGNLRALLVSIDPDHDTPAALREVAARHGADLSRWTFARTPKESVRQLAAVLGIQYRELQGGGFNHSTIITLLDAEGRVVARTAKMTAIDEEFLETLRKSTSP